MFRIRLKQLREEKHFSQAVLAKKLGVCQSTVGMWENGKNKPENAKLEALASLLDVSTDYLLGRAEQRQYNEKPLAEGEGLKGRIISLLDSLSPAELQRVDDFLSGLKSGQREHGSPRP